MLDRVLHYIGIPLRLLPDGAASYLALPILVVLMIVVIRVVLRYAPRTVADGSTVLGTLALLPEFLVTTLVRRLGHRPPNACYLYGEGVERVVLLGQRLGRNGFGALTGRRTTRRFVVLILLGAALVVGNAQSCAGDTSGTCSGPVAVWWHRVTDRAGDAMVAVKESTRPSQTPTP